MDHPDALTAEDLRGRLYHSLREKGLVDALKVKNIHIHSFLIMLKVTKMIKFNYIYIL